jgi:redox-sensing transcriptional repressor
MINPPSDQATSEVQDGSAPVKKMGLKKDFSHSLSEETGVSAVLIRKDFSQCGIRGKRRGGYDIDLLLDELKKLFGREKEQNVILVGLGNIGSALVKYEDYRQSNMNMVAAFDIDPAKRTRVIRCRFIHLRISGRLSCI